MKILVLNGSPKRDKSDTMFLEAVAATGPRLELVRRAGREYAERGEVGEGGGVGSNPEEIGLPMIPEETYAAIVNGER